MINQGDIYWITVEETGFPIPCGDSGKRDQSQPDHNRRGLRADD